MGQDASEDVAERLRQAIGRFVRVTRARTDTLPATQTAALASLDRQGPQTIAALAAGRGVKHQGMSRTVGELQALGLVSRAPNPADGRAFLITLTSQGLAALENDRAGRRNWIAEAITAELSDEERRTLLAVPALLDRLSELGEKDSGRSFRGPGPSAV